MRRVALILLLLVVTLALSEGAVRVVEAVKGKNYAVDLQPKINYGELLFVPHPYMGYVHRPGAVSRAGSVMPFHINSLGYRGPDFEEVKPPGQLRIACLGGSTVWGVGASGDDETWPAQLQRRLELSLPEGGPWTSVLVINAGVSGYTTLESFVDLKMRLLPMRPDVVIVYHGINDAHAIDRGRVKPDYTNARQPWSIPVPSRTDILLGWSHLYGLLAGRSGERLSLYDLVGMPDADAQPTSQDRARGVQYYADTLRQITAVARVSGAAVLLTSFCYTRQVPVREKWMGESIFRLIDRLNQVSRLVATEQETLFVDLRAAVGEDRKSFVDPIHLSDEGNRAIMGALAEELLRDGALWKLPSEPGSASR